MNLEERCRTYREQTNADCRAEALSETVLRSRQAYAQAEDAQTLGWFEFIYQQSRYIRKRWWALQAALLALLWVLMRNQMNMIGIRRCMGVLAPLFGILILPEMWKNRSSDAMEVECAALYSLRKIYAARMILFGFVDMLLLSVFLLLMLVFDDYALRSLLTDFFIPFNVSCCICLVSLGSRRLATPYAALGFGGLWIIIWSRILLDSRIYARIVQPVWALLLLLSFAFMLFAIVRLYHNCESLWEVNQSWDFK